MQQYLVQLAIKPADDLMQARVREAWPTLLQALRDFVEESGLMLEVLEDRGSRPSRLAQCAVRTKKLGWLFAKPDRFVFIINFGTRKHTLVTSDEGDTRSYESSPVCLHVYPPGVEAYCVRQERLPSPERLGKWFTEELRQHYARWKGAEEGT